jgi:hypothetical protein
MRRRFAEMFLGFALLFALTLPVQAEPLDNVFIRITDTDGNSVSGGKMRVFTCGTTTPVTTYSVSSSGGVLSVPHADPIVADSGGKIAAVYVPAGCYKIRYLDAADATLYEVDNYILPDIDAINANNFPVEAKSNDYTLVAADDGTTIAMDASAASPKTISARGQVLGNGFPFCAINTGATGSVVITPDAGETINGASSYTLTTQFQAVCLHSRGAAGWYIVAERDPAGTFTTAVTFNETATFNEDAIHTCETLTDAANISWNMSTSTCYTVTLGGNRTLDPPTGEAAGQEGHLVVLQDGTGGRTLTFDASYAGEGGLSMRPDPAISATTVYWYRVRGSNDVIFKRLWTSASDSIGTYIEYDLGAFNDQATLTQAHGLGRNPAAVQVYLEADAADIGYAVGDRVLISTYGVNGASNGIDVWFNATNVGVTMSSSLEIVSRTDFSISAIDEADWDIIVRVYE